MLTSYSGLIAACPIWKERLDRSIAISECFRASNTPKCFLDIQLCFCGGTQVSYPYPAVGSSGRTRRVGGRGGGRAVVIGAHAVECR